VDQLLVALDVDSGRRALELGYTFRHPDLDEALQSALRET